ncbi:MAG TPA: NirA family protein [Tepidisphaeraceae bacterium]|jgi:ferredoxin-nitrite reductase|nr:NirA family protein [Tepidisphaeraceae bacterium]
MNDGTFSEEQTQYLQGFAVGSGITRASISLPTFSQTLGLPAGVGKKGDEASSSPDAIHHAAQDRFLAAGKKLCAEEQAKRKLHGLDIWDEMLNHARDGRFPKGTDVFLFKFLGMFYVAPSQDAFMCRLRLPGGIVNSHQLHGIAELAREYGGGYADMTTRANLQIRQIGAKHAPDVVMGLYDLGIINRGAGADNIRNITASPTAGIDPQELIDTRPLARRMHHYILHRRELHGLPRKFNIAFDGGGSISALEDTNDIGFVVVRVEEGQEVPAGVYFRMILGGITGHKDFARDTGLLLREEECVEVAAAAVRVFIEYGDRTDRKKARLKYLLDQWGLAKFVEETEKKLSKKLTRFPAEKCKSSRAINKHAHIGVHAQKQAEKSYIGVIAPVGRLTVDQMHGVAEIAQRYGSGTIRLTVWQNLLISDISDEDVPAVQIEIKKLGLNWSATSIRAGLVACTGSAGCKYASADTKRHALALADHLESRIKLDCPINIHLTGCHHSCAQHFIGDIGMLATKVAVGEEMLEGYHVYVGGGYAHQQAIGRELYRDVLASDLPGQLEKMLRSYLDNRRDEAEPFNDFVRRHSTQSLKDFFDNKKVNS